VSDVHDFGWPAVDAVLNFEGAQFPPDNTLRFKMRSGETPSDLYLSLFVGPDGTVNTYYEESGLPLHDVHRGDQYFQYRVYLDCPDGLMAPYLDSVTLTADSLDYSDVADGAVRPTSTRPALRLSSPGSNPARGPVDVAVQLRGAFPSATSLRLRVVDATGRLVREARMPLSAEGTAEWRWNARDRAGQPVAAGFYQMIADLPGTDVEAALYRVLMLR